MDKRIFFIGLITCLAACKHGNPVAVNELLEPVKENSLQLGTQVKRALEEVIARNEQITNAFDEFASSPLGNPEDFTFKTGYQPLDKLKEAFDRDPGTRTSYRKGIENGDCGYYIQSMTRSKGEALHYVKGDCGEYGFSNEEVYFKNDSLQLVRGFFVGINTWPNEPEGSTWKVKEEICVFANDQVLVRKREVIVSDFFKSEAELKKKPFSEESAASGTLYKKKKKEVISTLEMKSTE